MKGKNYLSRNRSILTNPLRENCLFLKIIHKSSKDNRFSAFGHASHRIDS
jgi:hypothetical protein